MCELEHDAAKGRFEIHRDCSFERPLPRRRLHRSMNIAATARKCCVSNSRTCIRLVCPAEQTFYAKRSESLVSALHVDMCMVQQSDRSLPHHRHFRPTADLGATRSEGPQSALNVEMCMAQHLLLSALGVE